MNNCVYDKFHIIRKQYDYKLIINGIDIGKGYCIDDKALVNALSCSGEFYPFTCCCGDAGCAGLEYPVYCQRSGNTVKWHKIHPAPRETFTLDTEKALTELEKVLSEIFTELFEQYENDPWKESTFPHGPFGTTLITLRQARDLCRKHLHIKEAVDHQIKKVCLSSMLEEDCSVQEFITALKIGNIHETPGMANEEPIHAAAWHNQHTENIDLLLVRGADINVKDEYEETPLFYAVKGKNPEKMINHLLCRGADLEARNDLNQTPFLVALDYLEEPLEVIKILQSHGCSISVCDEYGNGALEYAVMRNHSEDVVKLLRQWGCKRRLKH